MLQSGKRTSLRMKTASNIGFTLRHSMMYNFYVLDASNSIVTVGNNWDNIAHQNGGFMAMSERVLGKPLSTFIAGTESASFINAVVFWARRERKVFATQYRFDSDDEAHLYAMKVVPKDDDFVLVTHQLLGTTQRPWQSTVTPVRERVSVARCSMCCHYKMGEDWIDPFTDLSRAYLPETHVICPDCKSRATVQMNCALNVGKVVQFRPRSNAAGLG